MTDPKMIQLYLSISVAIVMLGMGLSLTLDDFKRIIRKPGSILLGLFNQLVLLPIIGFAIVTALGVQGELAVGVMLIAACPGGATSNLISNLGRGDVGLSVSLTAFSSTITVFSIPFLVNLAAARFMGSGAEISLDFWETFFKMVMITILPVSTGMIIRNYALNFANKMERPVKIASVVLMSIVIIGAVLANKAKLGAALPEVGPAVIILNIATMLLGFFSARMFRLSLKQRVSISIECGIQNASLALFIGSLGALAAFPGVLLAPAIYGVLMFITGGVFATIYSRMVLKSERQSISQK